MADQGFDLPQGSSTEQPAFLYARSLLESAKAASQIYTGTFSEDEKFALGENQWPQYASYRAWLRDRWKNQSVRNYVWSTIRQKLAVMLSAEPTISVEPLSEEVTWEQRQDIASVMRHDMERARWKQMRRDVAIDGSILGKGIAHIYPLQDPLTGMFTVAYELVDPRRFYADPARTEIASSRYVVYEPEMDMASIRRIFPETYQLVKPSSRSVGSFGSEVYGRSAQDLIYGGSTGEFSLSAKDGVVRDRFSDVAFLYIQDQTVIEEAKAVLERAAQPGYHCNSCGADFPAEGAVTDPRMQGSGPMCPTCFGTELSRVTLPETYAYDTEKSKKYPFGRLICFTKDALLFDGDAKTGLRDVFPFAEYSHQRVTRRFWGHGDVADLKEVQRALNKNIAQAIDNLRYAGNAPMEVPAEVPAYRKLGNRPGDQIPVPAPFMGLARYLSPNSYNVNLHQIVDTILKRDFQEIAGVSDVSFGIAPQGSTSGVEVQARQAAANSRLGLHVSELNAFDSELANKHFQMANYLYREPRAFVSRDAAGNMEAIVREVSSFPADVQVVVHASIDQSQKDNLFGQNLVALVDKGQIGFYPDLMLPLMGATDKNLVREIAAREEGRKQQMAQAAQPGAPPPSTPGPAEGQVPPPPEMAGMGEQPQMAPQEG